MGILGRSNRHRSARALFVWALLFVQAEFLWVGEFHQHETPQEQKTESTALRDGKLTSSDTAPRTSCVACQIGLERAASPVVGRAPAIQVAVDRCPQAADPQLLHTILLAVTSPRAPPA